MVEQGGFGVDHAVREFMADDVDGHGEAVEDLAVAITKDHLRAIPEGVFVVLAVMHGAHQRQPVAVDGMALVDVPKQFVGGAQVRIGLVHRHVAAGRAAFGAHQRAGQGGGVLRVVYRAFRHAGRRARGGR
ncbi:hypothetical protein D3C87_1654600 [compost metagenome]